jgi:hypothetical protein
MRRLYGGHRIESIGHQKPDDNKWTAKVTVFWNDKGYDCVGPLELEDAFDSIAEAEASGIRFGKKWIDAAR